ncbi:MAG: diguanylate cyclase [Cyanobacteriota bacterium]|nr:diguanylate cyclase [Cyanobacteriota bacterium]
MQRYDPQHLLPTLEQTLDRHPVIIPSDLRLSEAIVQMSQNPKGNRHSSDSLPRRASCVLAIENSQLAGVLTERDIVKLAAGNQHLENATVAEVMTRQVVSLKCSDRPDLANVLQLLRQHRIRHLPIVDDCNYPVGIVTTESIRRALQPSNLLKFWSVKDVMVEQVTTVPPTTSVLQISQLMVERRLSCTVITEPHSAEVGKAERIHWRPVGIITERDIVGFQLLELDLANTQAREVMSAPLVCLNPTDSLWDVQQQMQQLRVRRLVVVGARGELQGLVTQTSLLQALDPLESYRVIESLRQELEARSSTLERTNEQLQKEVGERELLVKKLESSEAEMRAIFEAMTDIVLKIDLAQNSINILPTHAIATDESMARITHLTLDRFLSHPISNDDSQHADRFLDSVRRALSTGTTIEFEYDLTLESDDRPPPQDKQVFWFAASISPISETAAIWVARNITNRKHVEQALFEEKELAQVTLQSIGDAVITTDATGTIESFNPVAEQLTRWSAAEASGRSLGQVFNIVSEETGDSIDNLADLVLQDGYSGKLCDRALLIARDGTEYAIDESVTPIRDRQNRIIGAVVVFRDVTASRRYARQLSWEATHDTLTQLYNRRAFELELRQVLSSIEKQNRRYSLCYLDLDRFKIINDTCGHAAGDEVLKQVTALFVKHTRKIDTLARLGGDEFALLLDGCPLIEAEKIARKLQQAIAAFEFAWHDRTFTLGVSIGAIEIDRDRANLTEILQAADAACYTAKALGRNCVYIARPDGGSDITRP